MSLRTVSDTMPHVDMMRCGVSHRAVFGFVCVSVSVCRRIVLVSILASIVFPESAF